MPSNRLSYFYFHKDQNNIEVTDEDLTSSNLYLHWMVINVPGAKVDQGQTVTSYKGPAPKPGSGVHRYVILAYEQKSDTPMRIDHSGATFRTSFPCQVSIDHMLPTMPNYPDHYSKYKYQFLLLLHYRKVAAQISIYSISSRSTI